MKHKHAKVISAIVPIFILLVLISVTLSVNTKENSCQDTLASVVMIDCIDDYASIIAIFIVMAMGTIYFFIDHYRQRK